MIVFKYDITKAQRMWVIIVKVGHKIRDYFEELCDDIETSYKSIKNSRDELKKELDKLSDYWKGNTANLYDLSLGKKVERFEVLDYRFRELKKRLDFKVSELTDYLEKKNEQDKSKALEGNHYIDYLGYLWDDVWDCED